MPAAPSAAGRPLVLAVLGPRAHPNRYRRAPNGVDCAASLRAPVHAADAGHMLTTIAFQPVLLYSALGLSAVVGSARLILFWATD